MLASIPPQEAITGKPFERVCKHFLETSPLYRPFLKNVWLWEDWPERGGADVGIDIVCEAYDGTLWAVQAKHYAEDYYLKKADIDSFLAASSTSRYSYRLLISTTDKIGPNAQRTMQEQQKPVGVIARTDLRAMDLPWSDLLAGPVKLQVTKPLRPHQKNARRDVIRALQHHDRATMVMACGTGKTITSIAITEKLGAELIAVLVPSLSLMKQTVREWSENTKLRFRGLSVCSDSTVVDYDDLTEQTSELGFPVTTDTDTIEAFLADTAAGTRIVFATYQSSHLLAAAARNAGARFDLVLADEAHRCAGRAAGVFGVVLDDTVFPAAKRLFMTATPRLFSQHVKDTGDDAGIEIASMDNPDQFGPIAHTLTFGDAVRAGLLADYRVVVLGVRSEDAATWLADQPLLTRDGVEVVNTASLTTQIALLQATQTYDLRRIVSFHSRVKDAERFADDINALAALPSTEARIGRRITGTCVTGAMTAGDREARLNQLRYLDDGAAAMVTNARCLSEGVDVPSLDAVVFVDPRYSEIDIVQALGRVMRNAPNKTAGTVIIPVVIAPGDDVDTVLDHSTFKVVWTVLRALRAHDSALAEQLDELRCATGPRTTSWKRGRGGCVVDRIVLDLPTYVGDGFIDAFNLRVVHEAAREWFAGYGAAQRHLAAHGDIDVIADYVDPDGFPLGRWVGTQRAQLAAGNLTDERFALLDTLTGWRWSAQHLGFADGVAALRRWFIDGNSLPIAADAVTTGGFALGAWLTHQHAAHLAGTLTDNRAALLERLLATGATRNIKLVCADSDPWNTGLAHLKAHLAETGDPDPDPALERHGYPLGAWIAEQRTARRDGTIDPAREALLDSIPGWKWGKADAAWERNYALVGLYAAREGHTRVPVAHVEDGVALGRWVSAQRSAYRNGTLTPERQARLDSITEWRWATGRAVIRSTT